MFIIHTFEGKLTDPLIAILTLPRMNIIFIFVICVVFLYYFLFESKLQSLKISFMIGGSKDELRYTFIFGSHVTFKTATGLENVKHTCIKNIVFAALHSRYHEASRNLCLMVEINTNL